MLRCHVGFKTTVAGRGSGSLMPSIFACVPMRGSRRLGEGENRLPLSPEKKGTRPSQGMYNRCGHRARTQIAGSFPPSGPERQNPVFPEENSNEESRAFRCVCDVPRGGVVGSCIVFCAKPVRWNLARQHEPVEDLAQANRLLSSARDGITAQHATRSLTRRQTARTMLWRASRMTPSV